MEGIDGRSLGKMLLRLRVTRLDGEPIDMARAALESGRKAFPLPLDYSGMGPSPKKETENIHLPVRNHRTQSLRAHDESFL